MAKICVGKNAKLAVFLQPLTTHKRTLSPGEKMIDLPGILGAHLAHVYPIMSRSARHSLVRLEGDGGVFRDLSQSLRNVPEDLS